MNEHYTSDMTFDAALLAEQPIERGVFEECHFTGCDFSGHDFSGNTFIDTTFSQCNLSLVPLMQTGFRDVEFSHCKMLGLRFDTCDRFGISFSFDHCQLDHSSFYQIQLKKNLFRSTRLVEADFTESDLTEALFDDCDLSGALFSRSILVKADLRTSTGYTIDPESNNLKKAKFSLSGIPGLLYKYGIEIAL